MHTTILSFKNTSKKFLNSLEYAIVALLFFYIIYFYLAYSKYGIDIADESFYIISISSPGLYNKSLSQFGWFYSPIFKLFNGDIYKLRVANILAILLLGALLVKSVFSKALIIEKLPTHKKWILYCGFGTTVLAYAFPIIWIITPSYNSLNLIGVLIFSCGLINILTEENIFFTKSTVDLRNNYLYPFICAVGCFIVFAAKPSTFSLLLILYFIVLLFSNSKIIKFTIFIAALISLLIIFAFLVDGGLRKFYYRYYDAYLLAKIIQLGGPSNLEASGLFRIDYFPLDIESLILFLIITTISYCSFKNKYIFFLVFFLGAPLVILSPYIIFNRINFSFGIFAGFYLIAPLLAYFFHDLKKYLREFRIFSINYFVAGLIFVLIPYSYAFGSGYNNWSHLSGAIIFLLLSPFLFIRSFSCSEIIKREFLCLIIFMELCLLLIGASAISHPYGYHYSLVKNNCKFAFGESPTEIFFSDKYCDFLKEVNTKVYEAGFNKGAGIIDLTGKSPGVLYSLKAKSIGAAWLMGGKPGSLRSAVEHLNMVDCNTLSESWVLLEPGGAVQISPDNPSLVMNELGINFIENYSKAAYWITPIGIVGDGASRVQEIYQPIRPESIFKECSLFRREKKQKFEY